MTDVEIKGKDLSLKELSKIEENRPQELQNFQPQEVEGLNQQRTLVERSIIFPNGNTSQVWTYDETQPSKGKREDIPIPEKKYCTATYGGSQTYFQTWTKITVGANNSQFNTNDNNMRDTANNRINITSTGRYLLIGSLDARNTAGTTYDYGIAIHVNGNPVTNYFLANQVAGNNIDRLIGQCNKTINLTAGDYVELYGYSATSTTGTGTQNTFLEVQEL